MNIYFIKVKAHSDYVYNDLDAEAAKKVILSKEYIEYNDKFTLIVFLKSM